MIDARNLVTNPGGSRTVPNATRIGIAFHHSVSGQTLTPQSTEAQERAHITAIDNYHVSIGYGGFAYHAAVFPSGRAYQCGNLDSQRAHVAGRNHELLGVVLVGDFTSELPGMPQLLGTKGVIAEFRAFVGKPLPARGHGQWALPGSPSTCPGLTRDIYFDTIEEPEEEGQDEMPNPLWADWRDRPANIPYRTWLLFLTPDVGLEKLFVPSLEAHNALLATKQAGAQPTSLDLDTLKQYAGGPEPDEP